MSSKRSAALNTPGLFTLTWPIFIELLFGMLLGAVDTMMLSGYSDEAVAAVGIANQVLTVAGMIFGFITIGTAVMLNQWLGAGQFGGVERISSTSLTLNLMLGLIISAALFFFPEAFISLFHLSDEVSRIGEAYLSIVGGSMFMIALTMTLGTMLRCRGIVKEMMVLSLVINVINILGNYLVLMEPFGLPVLGVEGVAAVTWVCRIISLLGFLVLCYRKLEHPIRLISPRRIQGGDLRYLFKLGLPSAGEPVSYNLSQSIITYFITLLGAAALTTKIYTQNMTSFIFIISMAVGSGTQIIVGHLIGADKKEDAYRSGVYSLKVGLLLTGSVSVILYFISEPLLRLFTSDTDIIQLGTELFLLSIWLEPARACNMVLISSLNSAGDVRFPVIIGIISMWGISVPLAYVMGITLNMGLAGIWIAFAIDEWVRAGLMFYRWRRRAWKKVVLVTSSSVSM
ncbi:putative MATE family efflux protein [Paenibacillus endophyticus]|uniref:Putative MATE family efflux protein n=1 Tax=Paenibacillus endophyticus TaxID=1294268 RepID=A0A7W5GDW9_9BACL|nr:MATE family efflux transporter [Paenibacillus endophyticus]MBB3155903.1 putative MATE family efflux protein [Paenibacillus endophyticus]